jgi:hypothetical protein
MQAPAGVPVPHNPAYGNIENSLAAAAVISI